MLSIGHPSTLRGGAFCALANVLSRGGCFYVAARLPPTELHLISGTPPSRRQGLKLRLRAERQSQNLPAGCRRYEGQTGGVALRWTRGGERAARRRRTQPRIVLPYQRRGRFKYWQNVTLFLLRGGGVSVYCGASSEQEWGARCVRERGPFKNERFEQFSATR